MNTFTHFYMCDCIADNVERQTGIKLNTKMLKCSNAYADFSWLPRIHPHYERKSLDFVKERVTSLCGDTLRAQDLSLRILSFQIGVITHYLADFFCKAHAENAFDSLRAHLKYENSLNRYIKRNRTHCDELCHGQDFPVADNERELFGAMDRLQSRFSVNDGGYDNEVQMAVEASTCAVLSILNMRGRAFTAQLALCGA